MIVLTIFGQARRTGSRWLHGFTLIALAVGLVSRAEADPISITAPELTLLLVTNPPPPFGEITNTLTYILADAPAGMVLDANGVITWTPSEVQGPSTNSFTTVVSEGSELRATNAFTVIVTEVNLPPAAGNDAYTASNGVLTVAAPGVLANDVDPDWPTNTLTAQLVNGPTNGSLALDSSGGFNYTPNLGFSGADGFVYVVNDGQSNSPPAQVNLTVLPLGFRIMSVTLTGGVATVTWNSEAGKTYRLLRTDNLVATNWCPVTGDVRAVTAGLTNKSEPLTNTARRFYRVMMLTNRPPVLPLQTNVTVAELTLLTVTNTATDPDMPGEQLIYDLVAAPSGATIDASGVISWTPSEEQGPGTNVITTVVTDNGGLSATNSFTVAVTEVNVAPVLSELTNVTVAELTLLTVTNTAADADLPANELMYMLVAAPGGAAIDTNGVITWKPKEAQGPSTNTITTVVNDGTVSVTNRLVVTVTEVNLPPEFVATSTNQTIAELSLLMVTNNATDPDVPANSLTYALLDAPAGAAIDTSGVITWMPTQAQGPSTNTLTTVVSDGALNATNSFEVVVTEVNLSPVFVLTQTNRTIAELTALTVTNVATDADAPATILTYSLENEPSGATIDTNGVIHWIPSEAQGPGTNELTTIVTDNGGLSATNSFTVVVTEVNVAPVLPVQTNRAIAELSLLTVTNTATDADLPANPLTYLLIAAPGGVAIDTHGVISWMPTEAQGPGTNTITTVVNDGTVSVTNSFVVTVSEANIAPVAGNDTYGVTNALTVNAPGVLANDTDADVPANVLTAVLASGPTNGTLVLSNNGGFTYTANAGFSGADAFTYRASDSQTTSPLAIVTLTVSASPVITGQPVSQTVIAGSNANFSVSASGTAPLSFQWRKNATNLAGATSSALTLSNVQTNDAGSYQLVITNVVGAVTSAVATLTVTVPSACTPLATGAVGWWPGEGSAADIAGIYNGTLQGGATASATGKVGLAFNFDGTNNFVSIPDAPALHPTNLTIEAWVKFTGLDSAGTAAPAGLQYIVFKQNTRSSFFEGFFLGKVRNGSSDNFYFSVTSSGGLTAEVNSTNAIQVGTWYHIAGVRGPNNIQLFVNGQLHTQATVSFAQNYGTLPLYFGSSGQSSFDRKFKGVLDEVTLFGRALSAGEIAAIYNAGSDGKCKGPSAPAIVLQPTNQIYVLNGTATFSVAAIGTAPLGYRWYRDGFLVVTNAGITNASSPTLMITGMQPGDIGNYQVVVTNSVGSVTSTVASLNTGAPPVNDAFASATTISGSSGSVSGNNANATKQSGEPNHAGDPGGASVWYNWTAPSASPVTMDTTLSAFDTLLAVYTGNNVNSLTAMATNNNIGTNNSRSRVTFTPVAGSVYRIAVDGAGGDNGNLTLRWIQASVPLPDLTILGSAVNPRIVTETFASSSCAVMEGLVVAGTRRLIRFDTETANQGTADLFFGNPAVNPLFVYAPCHAHYHFQNYMSYRLRNASGQIATVGLKVGFCVLDVFRWDSGAPNNALYTCVNQGIQKGWGDLYDSTLDGQWLDITGLPDGNYTMEMEANPLGIIQETDYNNNITLVPITIGNSSNPPLNDNFANAQTLLGTSPSVTGLNLNATKQSNEPNHAGNAGGKSVWYNWTAPSTKAVTIDTVGSSFNTLLGVYTGSMVGNLSLVASNDDIIPAANLQSRVTFNATAGTIYRIAVDGFDGASSNLILTVNQTVANDNFSACIFIGGVLGSISGSDVGATKETNEPNHGGNPGGSSTWYCWTAPIAGTVTFDTVGSTFNTLLGVYTGNSVGALTTITSNDDIDAANTNLQSRVTFDAVGLTMYRIAVDGFNGDSGNTFLNWSFTAGGSSLASLNSTSSASGAAQLATAGQAVLSFGLMPEGMVQLGIQGQPQARYRVERSCDLQTWLPLATTVADLSGRAWFTDKAARHLNTSSTDAVCGNGVLGVAISPTEARFYRALVLP